MVKTTKKKKSSKVSREEKPIAAPKHRLKWFLKTLAKLGFVMIFALGIFTIYLDAKVRQTFEGQRWQVPIQVYGQVALLKINDTVNLQQLAQSLTLNHYKKVSTVNNAGEFSQSKHRLIIYRRAFTFAEGHADAMKLTIDASSTKISQLFIDDVPVSKLQLEPALLARIVPDNKEDRLLVSLESVPSQLLDTLLLIEDRDFYHHKGLSPLGILRALINNVKAGRTVQGGSTLTQQLVKNMFLTRERTLTRKIKEALMALILEYRYSKDQLLEAYINEVYLGQHYANGIYGFGLAAQFYFAKDISELNAQQIALLIGQVKGPSYYDPWRHPNRAKQRRDLVLRLMFEQNMLSRYDFEQAVEAPLSIRKDRRIAKQKYPAYLQLVKRELGEHLSDYQQESGVRVFTGFSQRSQQLLEQSVNKQVALLETKYHQKNLQAAMIVTDINSAEIRALVGGKRSGYAGFNRALNAKRPVGSLIKPAIYLAALERYEQYNFATLLDDKAITFTSDSGDKWRPKNYDGKYRGQVPLIDALVHSLNIPTVNLGMALGLENIASAIHLLGYQDDINLRPSMLLGAMNMSPLEINQLYLPIATHGQYLPNHAIKSVVSAKGETLWQFTDQAEQRLSTHGAYLIDYALKQVSKTGTAKSLTWRLKSAQPQKTTIAGKTGTSNDLRDSWFVGYDGKHLVTTWLGNDNNKPTGLTGSRGALVLFSDFMNNQGVVDNSIEKPAGITMTLFEQKTGNAVTKACDNTLSYPAILAGIKVQSSCLKKRVDSRSWLEKIFG
ncbi:MAG: penicillin-binding protein 1B [Colwellia sp.]